MTVLTYVPSRIGEGFFADVPIPGSGDDDKALTYDHATGKFVYAAFDPAGTAAAAVAAHVALSNPHDQYELESANTAAAILTKLLTVDGAGSGLDADLLDGQSSAAFLPAASFVPPGSTTQVLFNDGGAWGGDAGLTYAKATDRLTISGGLVTGDISPPSDSTTAFSVWNASRSARLFTVDTTNNQVLLPSGNVSAPSIAFEGDVGTGFYRFAASSYALSLGATYFAVFRRNGTFTQMQLRTDKTGVSINDDIIRLDNAAGNTLSIVLNDSATATELEAWRQGVGYDYHLLLNPRGGRVGVGISTAPAALLDIAASTTARASLRLRSGTAPTSPNDGDVWFDGADFKCRIGGVTKTFTVT